MIEASFLTNLKVKFYSLNEEKNILEKKYFSQYSYEYTAETLKLIKVFKDNNIEFFIEENGNIILHKNSAL